MAGRPYVLAETTWKTVKETDYEVAILPWGATEAHNTHLPYGTDNIECDLIGAEAARYAWEKGARVVLLPTVPFGVNTGQLDVKLDINMHPSTQLAVLTDVVEALERQGIPKLVILNGHGGNDFRQMIRELLVKSKLFICSVEWWRSIDMEEIFEEPGDHAGEMETSLMQIFAPDWVLPLSEAGDGDARGFRIAGLREGWAWTQREWPKVTKDTGVGNPAAADPEKGKRCLAAMTQTIGNFLVEVAEVDPEDPYEERGEA